MKPGRTGQQGSQGSAADSVKESLLRFVEPGRRGEFLAALRRFAARREVSVDGLRDLVKPFLRYGLAGEFEAFVKRVRK